MEDNKKFQVFNFFPTPVFCNNIDIDVDTKEFLLNSSFERMTSNNGNMSENNFILDNEVCNDFVDKHDEDIWYMENRGDINYIKGLQEALIIMKKEK